MGLFTTSSASSFPWKALTSVDQLQELIAHSNEKPVLLFKHSTRCSISSMALNQFEREWQGSDVSCELYYLDLLNHRDVSNKIEELTGVVHQSPQAILLKNGVVVYDASHHHISANSISQNL